LNKLFFPASIWTIDWFYVERVG